ncbi:2-oxoglutarate dehydrogenase, E2 component, dihydrolipoamide succinyltransferase, partial [Streptomyces sp. H34-S5]|nr:2-oxoglutarate dehydrogenase, E2 component, dihydrolipoamide succinyltransferase [Streptomyces sp. H34-S5]
MRVHVIATATVAALVTLAVPSCTAASDEAPAAAPTPGTRAAASARAATPGAADPTPVPTTSPALPLATAP